MGAVHHQRKRADTTDGTVAIHEWRAGSGLVRHHRIDVLERLVADPEARLPRTIGLFPLSVTTARADAR